MNRRSIRADSGSRDGRGDRRRAAAPRRPGDRRRAPDESSPSTQDRGRYAIDTARTAILVVDMQNDFGSEGGCFHRAGIDISMIQRGCPADRESSCASARASGIRAVYLKMAFRSDLSDAGARDSPNYVRHRPIPGRGPADPGARRPPQPRPGQGHLEHRHHRGTDTSRRGRSCSTSIGSAASSRRGLDAILKRAGIKSLIVTGCTTSICVESTIQGRHVSRLLLRAPQRLHRRAHWIRPATEQSRGVAPDGSRRCSAGWRIRTSSARPSRRPRQPPRSGDTPGAARACAYNPDAGPSALARCLPFC